MHGPSRLIARRMPSKDEALKSPSLASSTLSSCDFYRFNLFTAGQQLKKNMSKRGLSMEEKKTKSR